MADTASLIKDLASGGNASGLDLGGNSSEREEGVLNASDSTVEGDIEHEDTTTSTDTDSSEDSSPEAKISPDVEEIVISDDKGRRKIKVDYSNKEQVKNFVKMAYGARKWQAERDQARAEVAPVRQQLEEMRTNWDTLENAFRSNGIEGVIDLLEGSKGAYKTHLGKAMERQEFLRRASPEELEALEAKELAANRSTENDRLRKEFEELKAKVSADKEASETRAVESRIHPAFDKYRFADKLGDPNDESMFDQMLWRTAMDRLEPYEEQYGNAGSIPQEVIEREFRAVAQSIRKRISVQAEKKAGKVLEQKKQEATEHVQAKVQSGYKTGGARVEAQKLMNQGAGGLTQILQNMGKYGFGKNK